MPQITPSYVQVSANNGTYRIRVETNRAGREFLSITEVRSDGSSERHRRRVIFNRRMLAFYRSILRGLQRLEPNLKAYDVREVRRNYPNAYRKWTPEDDQQLVARFMQGLEVPELARLLGRKPGGIYSRLAKLGWIA